MLGWTGSQCLFFGGAVMMAISVGLGVVSTVVFILTGKRIKKSLEREYGKLQF